MRTIAALLAAVSLVPSAGAREVAGVAVAEELQVGGKTLVLNGAGVRKRFIVKVYVGALYLEARSADAEAIAASDQARVVRMTFLRDVDRESIIKAFHEGFEHNSKDEAAGLVRQLAAVEKELPPEIKKGQVMVIAYSPGAGSSVAVEGGASAGVEGKAFGDALLRNWLGPHPADRDLKEAMLGK
jgi:hypothetical protein